MTTASLSSIDAARQMAERIHDLGWRNGTELARLHSQHDKLLNEATALIAFLDAAPDPQAARRAAGMLGYIAHKLDQMQRETASIHGRMREQRRSLAALLESLHGATGAAKEEDA